jgi:hypothetical protein
VFRFKLFGIAVLAVFTVGVAAVSSASALLPTVLFLSGTTSVLLKGSKEGANTAIFRTKALIVTSGKVTVEGTALTSSTHLGTSLLIFSESKDLGTGNTCTQTGQAAGTVHITAPWHLVYVALGASLKVAGLALIPKTTFVCGEANLSVEGSQLVELAKIPTETDGTEIEGISKCEGTEKLTPGLLKYENESGETLEAKLTSTIAGIKEKTCDELSSGLVLTGQMFKIDL